jgi:HlyD family secretion protein
MLNRNGRLVGSSLDLIVSSLRLEMNSRCTSEIWPRNEAIPLIVALSLLAGCNMDLPKESSPNLISVGANEDPGPIQISALGRIQPNGGIISVAGQPGARISQMKISEGQVVKSDETLFRLETYRSLDANCKSIEVQIREAMELCRLEDENSIFLGRGLAIEAAQALEFNPLDIEVQKEKLNATEKKLEHSQLEYNRLSHLQMGGSSSVSQQQIDAQKLLVDGAFAEKKAETLLLTKLTKGQDLADRRIKLKKEQILNASERSKLAARLESLRAGLIAAQLQRDLADVKAPRDGRVLRILTRVGETIGNQAVLQMGDTTTMTVIAEVSETNLFDLRRVTRAEITALAGNLKLHGTISQEGIGRVIGRNEMFSLNPTVEADRRVVEVRIELDAKSSRLARDLTNLQVDVLMPLGPGPAPVSSGATTVDDRAFATPPTVGS